MNQDSELEMSAEDNKVSGLLENGNMKMETGFGIARDGLLTIHLVNIRERQLTDITEFFTTCLRQYHQKFTVYISYLTYLNLKGQMFSFRNLIIKNLMRAK